MDILLWIFIAILILLSLPSTLFFFVFIGVFKRDDAKSEQKSEQRVASLSSEQAELTKKAKQLNTTEQSIKAFDGITLKADYYDAGSNTTVILAHGYRSTPVQNFAIAIDMFINKGYNILIVYQRAHGKSAGHFSTMGAKEQYDILSWIDFTDKTECKNIIVYGISMGCTALGLASNKITSSKVKALILDCGFTSFYNEFVYMLKRRKFYFVNAYKKCISFYARLFLHIDIKEDSTQSLPDCKIPCLFLHGIDDYEVQYQNTVNAYNSCNAPKEMITVMCNQHALNLLIGGAEVRNRLINFIDNYID